MLSSRSATANLFKLRSESFAQMTENDLHLAIRCLNVFIQLCSKVIRQLG